MPDVKMQLIERGEGVVLIDMDSEGLPLSEEQKRLVAMASYTFGMPENSLVLRDQTPDAGGDFTELNCAEVRQALDTVGLNLDEQALAEQIAEIFRKHGDGVDFDPEIKPLEDRGRRFLHIMPDFYLPESWSPSGN